MYNLDKNFKVAIFVLIVLVASIFAVFLYIENQQNVSEEFLQEQSALIPIGAVEPMRLILDDGSEVLMFIQAYNLRDTYGNVIDSEKVQSVRIKYPDEKDFYSFSASSIPDGAIFRFLIWPPKVFGEYILRIEYEDGTVSDETVNWKGIVYKSSIKTFEARTESNGTISRAYQIEDLDISSFEEMYHIRPNSSITRIETAQDGYFWLKASDTMHGKHVLLIKKEGIWYQSSILIVDERIPGVYSL